MKGLENQSFLFAYIISNILALVLLLLAWKQPKIARMLFVLLFGWACWINWKTALQTPQFYLDYAALALLPVYETFIRGWFSQHISQVVPFIATCQGLIALALLSKGGVYKAACIGAIVFLLAIMPLGVGSGFPCTFIAACAMAILFRKQRNRVWQNEKYSQPYAVAVD